MRAIEYYVESIGSLNSFKASNNCQSYGYSQQTYFNILGLFLKF